MVNLIKKNKNVKISNMLSLTCIFLSFSIISNAKEISSILSIEEEEQRLTDIRDGIRYIKEKDKITFIGEVTFDATQLIKAEENKCSKDMKAKIGVVQKKEK